LTADRNCSDVLAFHWRSASEVPEEKRDALLLSRPIENVLAPDTEATVRTG